MPLVTGMPGDYNLFATAARVAITHRDAIAVGELVRANTSSNFCVDSCANDTSFTAAPIGRVESLEKGSEIATVQWLNVRAIFEIDYSTVPTLGSNVITANDQSTVTGSVTFGAQDNTYVWGIDTGNTRCTVLCL